MAVQPWPKISRTRAPFVIERKDPTLGRFLLPDTSTEEAVLLTEQDLYLFNEGSHLRLYHKLGAHPCRRGDIEGTAFAVWAPSAEWVAEAPSQCIVVFCRVLPL